MDREPNPRGDWNPGHRLRRAPSGICARVSRPTRLRRPTGLSASRPSSSQQRGRSSSGGSDGGLAAISGGSGSCAGATGPAPADRYRGALGPSAGSGRGHPDRSKSILCLGAGLLVLERRLGMGKWPLSGPPQTRRGLGRRTLGETRPRLYLDRRRLAVGGTVWHRRSVRREAMT
jgi:hypothetical protein